MINTDVTYAEEPGCFRNIIAYTAAGASQLIDTI